eukprot:4231930-Prymnesium_polylepis.1
MAVVRQRVPLDPRVLVALAERVVHLLLRLRLLDHDSQRKISSASTEARVDEPLGVPHGGDVDHDAHLRRVELLEPAVHDERP